MRGLLSYARLMIRPRPARLAVLLGSLLGGALIGIAPPTALQAAASDLLEQVKQNPQQARALCAELRALNSQGISALSRQGIATVAQRQGLGSVDAEVLTTYVVGLHCPDVR